MILSGAFDNIWEVRVNRYKKSIITILLVIGVICITGCGKDKVPQPKEGRYVSADGNSSIILSDYVSDKGDSGNAIGKCNIQFVNVDLSDFYAFAVNNSVANYVVKYFPDGCTEEEEAMLADQFENQIDIHKQFCENKAQFNYFYSDTNKGYGLMSEIQGSGFDGAYENYVTIEYKAGEKAIVCNEIKYILEDS